MNPNHAEVSCNGKVKFTSSKARQVATDMRRRGRKKMDSYHCKHCGDWHIGASTHIPDKRKQGKNERRSGQDGDEA